MRFALLLIFIPSFLFAAFTTGEITSSYRGMRPLGMGGAHVAVADDYNALFYNPAGLNSIKAWKVEVFTLGLGINAQIKNLYNKKDQLGGDTAQIVQVVEDSIGKNHHVNFEFVPSWVMHNFGVALVEDFKFNFRLRNQAFPEFEVNLKNDVVVATGIAGRFWDRVQLGIVLKGIARVQIKKDLGAVDLLNDDLSFDDIIKEGQGWGIDLGVNYILPFPFKQKVGLQIADVLDSSFSLGMVKTVDGSPEPDDIKRTFNLGYKIEPPGIYFIKPIVAIDFRDVLNASKSSYIKRLHFGTEIHLPFIFALRFGFHQGYFTFGASADVWLLTFDFVSFAEELGVGYQNPDRRYYLRISLGF